MKKIKLSFNISGIVYIENEEEKDNKGNLQFKTIKEMREFYAKLHEQEQSENVSDK